MVKSIKVMGRAAVEDLLDELDSGTSVVTTDVSFMGDDTWMVFVHVRFLRPWAREMGVDYLNKLTQRYEPTTEPQSPREAM